MGLNAESVTVEGVVVIRLSWPGAHALLDILLSHAPLEDYDAAEELLAIRNRLDVRLNPRIGG